MGADTSATHLIFFIVSVIIALSVTGALFMNVQSISNAAVAGSKTLSEQLRTDITIINDPESIPLSGGNYTFYVKNTGKEDLSPAYISVIIDGSLISGGKINKTILEGDAMWSSGDVLEIDVATSLNSGSHKIRVVTNNGIDDELDFKIT
jgi:flagellar protein FlaG